jgi:hypothetical protein
MEDKLCRWVGIDVVVHIIADIQHHMWSANPTFKTFMSQDIQNKKIETSEIWIEAH